MNLNPRPNNGTLRLPLKPIGVHTPGTTPAEPLDPDPSPVPSTTAGEGSEEGTNVISISPIEASSAADPNVVPPHLVGVDPADEEDEMNVDRPVVGDESEMTEDEKTFWEWLQGKLDGWKVWLEGVTGKENGTKSS